jgi:hypothetical protein
LEDLVQWPESMLLYLTISRYTSSINSSLTSHKPFGSFLT